MHTKAIEDLLEIGRFDPEFFLPAHEKTRAALERYGARTLGSFVSGPRRGTGPDYSESGTVPVVRSVNVRQLEFSSTRREFVTSEFARANPRSMIPENALVVTSTGVGTLGRTFANVSGEELFADGHLAILEVELCDEAAFLCAFLQTSIGRQQIVRWHRGSSRQIEIYPEDLKEVLVPTLQAKLCTDISSSWLESVRRVQATASNLSAAQLQVEESVGWPDIASDREETRSSGAFGTYLKGIASTLSTSLIM